MIDVTLVTRNASRDALTDADYLSIIDSLRGPLFGYSWQRIADETKYNAVTGVTPTQEDSDE